MIPAQNLGSQPTQFFVTQLKENARSEARVGEAGVAALTIDSCTTIQLLHLFVSLAFIDVTKVNSHSLPRSTRTLNCFHHCPLCQPLSTSQSSTASMMLQPKRSTKDNRVPLKKGCKITIHLYNHYILLITYIYVWIFKNGVELVVTALPKHALQA